ncbi:MAG: glycine betaine ABC transporter substrate-binding protein [Halanaerobiales bacterium]
MNKYFKIGVFLFVFILITGSFSVVEADETIVLGEQTWTGIQIKNEVVGTILENIGYEVDYKEVIGAPLYQGLSTGDIDVWLGGWLSQKDTYESLLEDGEIERAGYNLIDTIYSLAVPGYVYEEGVTSMADLDEHKDKFDGKFYLGEPGGAATQYMEPAKEDDTYGFGDWEMLTGTFSAQLAEVEAKIDNEEWVVFAGWTPHWMDHVWDIEFLEDPEGLWGDSAEMAPVNTFVNPGLKEDNPNVYRFIEQVKVTSKMANEWIYDKDQEEKEREEIAEEWIEDNIDVVDQWLWDVKDASGENLAWEVLRENMDIE